MANYPTRTFWGTAQTCINLATDIADGNFSGAPSAAFDNTTDAVVPFARQARATAQFPDWAAAPTSGSIVELWGVLQDTDGTSDDTDAPSGTSSNGGRYFGAFVIDDVDALQRRSIVISLEGINASVNFYFKNLTGQNMNNDAGTNATLKVTPFADGIVV